MDLHTAGHRRGVVAAPHHAVAAELGHVRIDAFWLVREPSGRVRALMAAGRAGANARRELYRDYETIPPRGALAALTAPSAVAGWMLALEVARAHGGRLRLGDLLAPAIVHA